MTADSATVKPTILVVDDDEGLRTLIGGALRAEGYPVASAASGGDALRLILEQPPDLMLLDLKLRDMAGQGLLKDLQSRGRLVPFIVITGQGDEKIAVEMMRSGAIDYLRKDTAMLDLLPGVIHRAMMMIRAEQQLAAETRERRKLESELLDISENEQRRLGQDLHDGLGQQLTAIEFMCQSLVDELKRSQPEAAVRLARVGGFMRDAIAQTRTLAHSLARFRLDVNGLRSALAELAEQACAARALQCHFESPDVVTVGDEHAALHLYRIAQEAVQNALKHSKGTTLTVSLRPTAAGLELKVCDNGLGGTGKAGAGMGLRIMQHRANVIGAKLEIEAVPGKGTTVSCLLPNHP